MKQLAGWSATLTLAAACAPLFGVGSGPVAAAPEYGQQRGTSAGGSLSVGPLAAAGAGPTASVSARSLAVGWALGSGQPPHSPWAMLEDDRLLLRPCSLVALERPDPAPQPGAPPVYPSLGGPLPSLTPLDDLPTLRDETRHEDPDDALRLLRSRW